MSEHRDLCVIELVTDRESEHAIFASVLANNGSIGERDYGSPLADALREGSAEEIFDTVRDDLIAYMFVVEEGDVKRSIAVLVEYETDEKFGVCIQRVYPLSDQMVNPLKHVAKAQLDQEEVWPWRAE